MTSHLVEVPEYTSDEWVALRRRGLGASELAIPAGLDPYRGEYELALEKHGEAEPFTGNAATRWGHVIEGLALDHVEEETGIKPIIRGETFADDRWPHLWATLDGRHERIGYEVKATTRWSDPPPVVRVQCLAQMGLASLERVEVVRVSPYGEPIITTIERDEQAITDLLDLGEAWYVRYVEGDEMPAVDGSKGASRHLDRFKGTEERVATTEQEELLDALKATRRSLKVAEEADRHIVNQLKASMAATGVLQAQGARVTWADTKARTKVDWHKVAQMYRSLLDAVDPDYLDDMEQRHTTTGEPGTRFAVKYEEET